MILMIVNIIINIFTIVDYDSNDVQTASLVVCLIRLQLDCFSTLIVSLLLQSLKFALWLIKRMITLLITLTIIRTMAMITSSCCLFFYRIKCILQQKKFNTTCEAQGILIGGSSACLGSAKLDWFLCFLLPRLFSYSSFTIPGGDICIIYFIFVLFFFIFATPLTYSGNEAYPPFFIFVLIVFYICFFFIYLLPVDF